MTSNPAAAYPYEDLEIAEALLRRYGDTHLILYFDRLVDIDDPALQVQEKDKQIGVLRERIRAQKGLQ